jgi:hypothetical protein
MERRDRTRYADRTTRFIKTPIMSEDIGKRLGSALVNMGSDFAEVEDSVKAVLRVACDEGINGMISLSLA